MWQLIAMQAGQALAGGLLDREEQKRQNTSLNRSKSLYEQNLNRLVEDRKSIANYRRGESQQFLNDYAMTMDPERSRAIANMYGQGQERFRAELQSNDQLQDQVRSNIANIEAQRLEPKSFLELGVGSLIGAGKGYRKHNISKVTY